MKILLEAHLLELTEQKWREGLDECNIFRMHKNFVRRMDARDDTGEPTDIPSVSSNPCVSFLNWFSFAEILSGQETRQSSFLIFSEFETKSGANAQNDSSLRITLIPSSSYTPSSAFPTSFIYFEGVSPSLNLTSILNQTLKNVRTNAEPYCNKLKAALQQEDKERREFDYELELNVANAEAFFSVHFKLGNSTTNERFANNKSNSTTAHSPSKNQNADVLPSWTSPSNRVRSPRQSSVLSNFSLKKSAASAPSPLSPSLQSTCENLNVTASFNESEMESAGLQAAARLDNSLSDIAIILAKIPLKILPLFSITASPSLPVNGNATVHTSSNRRGPASESRWPTFCSFNLFPFLLTLNDFHQRQTLEKLQLDLEGASLAKLRASLTALNDDPKSSVNSQDEKVESAAVVSHSPLPSLSLSLHRPSSVAAVRALLLSKFMHLLNAAKKKVEEEQDRNDLLRDKLVKLETAAKAKAQARAKHDKQTQSKSKKRRRDESENENESAGRGGAEVESAQQARESLEDSEKLQEQTQKEQQTAKISMAVEEASYSHSNSSPKQSASFSSAPHSAVMQSSPTSKAALIETSEKVRGDAKHSAAAQNSASFSTSAPAATSNSSLSTPLLSLLSTDSSVNSTQFSVRKRVRIEDLKMFKNKDSGNLKADGVANSNASKTSATNKQTKSVSSGTNEEPASKISVPPPSTANSGSAASGRKALSTANANSFSAVPQAQAQPQPQLQRPSRKATHGMHASIFEGMR